MQRRGTGMGNCVLLGGREVTVDRRLCQRSSVVDQISANGRIYVTVTYLLIIITDRVQNHTRIVPSSFVLISPSFSWPTYVSSSD
jgi:hypothetical protein